jgi:Leucine-rich repeat (LRR) protein
MAQILPEEMTSLSNLFPSSKTVCRILEQNLSDEWECHAALSGNNIARFIITSPDLGVLVLCISNCSPDQFDSFSSDIPQLKQQYLDTVRQHLRKEDQFCNEDKSLKFPVGFGLIFTELSSDYANSATTGTLSEFVLFNDELRGMTNSDTELEDRLFDMVEEFDFKELDDDELQIINNNIPSIHVALKKVKKETDEVPEKQIDQKRWWNSLDDEWKNIFMKAIGDNEIYDLPSQVERILNWTKLDCNSSHITDLEPLKNLKNLNELDISDTQVRNLKPLKNLKNLNELDISDTRVRNLKPLKNLKNLNKLRMRLTQVRDLKPLKNLKSLNNLFVAVTQVSDLEPLKNLKSLKTLNIYGTQVSDLEPLKNLKSLKTLFIFRTQVSDLEPLKNLKNLNKLDISDTQVSDLEPLKNLKSLKELDISYTQVSDLEPLRNLKNLNKLDISYTQVRDLEPLRNLKNLERVYASHSRVTSILPLPRSLVYFVGS